MVRLDLILRFSKSDTTGNDRNQTGETLVLFVGNIIDQNDDQSLDSPPINRPIIIHRLANRWIKINSTFSSLIMHLIVPIQSGYISTDNTATAEATAFISNFISNVPRDKFLDSLSSHARWSSLIIWNLKIWKGFKFFLW